MSGEKLDIEKYQPLAELGIQLTSAAEIEVVKKYIKRQKNENAAENPDIFQCIFRQNEFLATCRTFSCSTALCESSFSTLTRIDRPQPPQRRSMLHPRLGNLTHLAFEKENKKHKY
ncbi:unnamed protein product [Psylliodes chrysocephalus]|uniref:HAT C-terminal dimerisation domain-containing protein n=1 Tax=Psylliodes chrysocephalus TaxID=3402493 RepID=A0A9P0GH44_9CUCU|nr:unnamed protein product [Psylliodes chrysocephala]